MARPAITRLTGLQLDSDTKSKEKGLYVDTLTTVQRNAIPTKTDGLVIFNTNTKTLQAYENSAWANMNTEASFVLKRTVTAGDYQILITDVLIGVTDTTAARNITLPVIANTIPGQIFTIKDESNQANAVTIVRNADGANIDGAAANVTITTAAAGGVVSLYSTGTAWFTIEKRLA